MPDRSTSDDRPQIASVEIPGPQPAPVRPVQPSIAMLASHPAQRDPRIGWEIGTAMAAYSVRFIGIDDQTLICADNVPRVARQSTTSRPGRRLLVGDLLRLLWQDRNRPGLAWRLALLPLFLPIILASALLTKIVGQALPYAADPDSGRHGGSPVSASRRFSVAMFIHGLRQWARSLPPDSIVFRSLRFPWIFYYILRCNIQLWNTLIEEEERFDIIHCNDFDTLIAGVLYRLRYGARVVYDAHEFWPYSYGAPPKLQSWLMLRFEDMFIGHADAVVTVNPLLAAQMREAYHLSRVDSVLNAEPWSADRAPLSGRLPAEVEAAKVRFVFIGGLSLERGLQELFEAWSIVNPREAVLIVYGPDNQVKRQLEQYVAELGEGGRSIFFLPSLSESDIVSAAMRADVGVIPYKPVTPNYRYCCPNKLSQYLHAGLMILANSTEFVASIVRRCDVGIVYDSSRQETIVGAISRAVADENFRIACKERALRLAKRSFNWQAQEATLKDIYDRLSVDPRPDIDLDAPELKRLRDVPR